MNISLSKHRN